VLLAAAAVGVAGAVELARREYVAAALLVQLKTVLDNADGQLARASRRVSLAGRYLDSESDLLVNAAVCAALGYAVGAPLLALAGFVALTLVLSVNFNLERLYHREHGGEGGEAEATGAAAVLARVYALAYLPHDRLIEAFVERRLRRLGGGRPVRLAYHDRGTLRAVANLGLSTQLAVLGLFLLAGRPGGYLWFALCCAAALVPLELHRGLRARRLAVAPEAAISTSGS